MFHRFRLYLVARASETEPAETGRFGTCSICGYLCEVAKYLSATKEDSYAASEAGGHTLEILPV
jgi:hypothetical protein